MADRQRLVNVLCRHNPDLLTPILRDIVTAYEPIIRAIHNAVDLSGTVYDAQVFIDDFIKVSKTDTNSQPGVSDYVSLLERHQRSTHRFLHQVTKNGKEMTEEYRLFVHEVAGHFRRPNGDGASPTQEDQMSQSLNDFVASLPSADVEVAIHEIDHYAAYLALLYFSSSERTSAVFSGEKRDQSNEQPIGPGAYIERWQSLLDETEITPANPEGPVRRGSSDDAKRAARIDTDGEKKGDEQKEKEAEQQMRKAPDVSGTRKLLGMKFRELLRDWQE